MQTFLHKPFYTKGLDSGQTDAEQYVEWHSVKYMYDASSKVFVEWPICRNVNSYISQPFVEYITMTTKSKF